MCPVIHGQGELAAGIGVAAVCLPWLPTAAPLLRPRSLAACLAAERCLPRAVSAPEYFYVSMLAFLPPGYRYHMAGWIRSPALF